MVIDRSDGHRMSVKAVSLLLAALPSKASLPTTAELVMPVHGALWPTRTVTVKLADCPLAMAPSEHTGPVEVGTQSPWLAWWRSPVTPVGRVSVTTTLGASSGPLLVAVTV